jgi:hypothetical protein
MYVNHFIPHCISTHDKHVVLGFFVSGDLMIEIIFVWLATHLQFHVGTPD